MLTEYQPPAEHAATYAAAPGPAPPTIPPGTPQPQRNEAAAPAPEIQDDWLAIALDALDYAIGSDRDRFVTPINKAKLIKKLLNAMAFYASQDGGKTLNPIEINILIRPYAKLLADQLPKVKDNREDHDYQRVKDRIRNDKKQEPCGDCNPIH